MPRVSDEHLEARRRQILDAARRCFVADGFHSTSMQDILREAGLSAGAVYRYFPSKVDIIAAIAEEAMSTIGAAFEREPEAPLPLLELLEGVLEAVDAHADQHDVGRLALQLWAEAGRNPELRERVGQTIRDKRGIVAARLRRQYGEDIDAERVAAVVVAFLPGYLHARVFAGDMTPARYCAGLGGVAELIAAPAPLSR